MQSLRLLTAVPTEFTLVFAKVAESAVMIMYATSIIDVELRKSFLRPMRSTRRAALTAMIRFHKLRKPLRRVCWVTDVTPTESRMMAK